MKRRDTHFELRHAPYASEYAPFPKNDKFVNFCWYIKYYVLFSRWLWIKIKVKCQYKLVCQKIITADTYFNLSFILNLKIKAVVQTKYTKIRWLFLLLNHPVCLSNFKNTRHLCLPVYKYTLYDLYKYLGNI